MKTARTERELTKMITKKYTNPDAEHHKKTQASGDTTVMVKTTANFMTSNCVGVTQNFPNVSVSNREYEEREKKKEPKILRPLWYKIS